MISKFFVTLMATAALSTCFVSVSEAGNQKVYQNRTIIMRFCPPTKANCLTTMYFPGTLKRYLLAGANDTTAVQLANLIATTKSRQIYGSFEMIVDGYTFNASERATDQTLPITAAMAMDVFYITRFVNL